MTWPEWIDEQWEQMREAAAIATADIDPPLSTQAISTARDSYGWRGLHGTHVSLTQPLSHTRDAKENPPC